MTTNNTGVKHDIEQLIPTIGTTGIYKLNEPYASKIDPNIEYTCISTVNLSGMIAMGLNPKADIYLANGDTEENYNIDLELNRVIITLQSGKGDIVSVPNSSLIGMPDSNGINYLNIVLGISLSIIPEYLDLTDIKNTIKNEVFNKLGVESDVYEAVVGGSIMITHDKHELIETSREFNINNSNNLILVNSQLVNQNTKLLEKITALETYIKSII